METQLSVQPGTSLFSASQALQRCQLCRTIPSGRTQTGQLRAEGEEGWEKGLEPTVPAVQIGQQKENHPFLKYPRPSSSGAGPSSVFACES